MSVDGGWKQVFVLSLPRSGSTLLRLLLDTHPNIACPGELSLGQLTERLHHVIYYTSAQLAKADDIERSIWAAEKARVTIDDLMTSYAQAKGKRIWAEKTPSNLKYADLLKRTFPKAAFLCLHRHPLDLIRSGFESARHGRLQNDLWDYQSGCDFCISEMHILMEFEAANPDRCLRIRYEDIVEDPVKNMAAIFNFLQLESSPDIEEKVFSTEHERGLGDPKAEVAKRIYKTSIGRGDEILPFLSEISTVSRKRLEELIVALGYPKTTLSEKVKATKANNRTVATQDPSASITELFRTRFPTKLLGNHDLRGSALFKVKGNGGGNWIVNLNTSPPFIGDGSGDADCTITIKADDLLKLASGELSAGECYMQAKVRVDGNEAVAISLGRVLFG